MSDWVCQSVRPIYLLCINYWLIENSWYTRVKKNLLADSEFSTLNLKVKWTSTCWRTLEVLGNTPIKKKSPTLLTTIVGLGCLFRLINPGFSALQTKTRGIPPQPLKRVPLVNSWGKVMAKLIWAHGTGGRVLPEIPRRNISPRKRREALSKAMRKFPRRILSFDVYLSLRPRTSILLQKTFVLLLYNTERVRRSITVNTLRLPWKGIHILQGLHLGPIFVLSIAQI